MRCKNCGSENDENLYICQNCGSPLYDEDENTAPDSDPTQVFSAVSESGKPIRTNAERLEREREEEKKKKQSMIIIAVLAILLIAIIGGIIFAVAKSKSNNETTAPVTISTTTEEAEETTTTSTTKETTTKETTESTTEETTESTTKETTTEAPQKFKLTTTYNNGGETEGDGSYELGETATVIARPDDGYSFDGWYQGSKKVSSNTAYTFTVTKDTKLKAVFVIDNPEPQEDINNIDDAD